MWGKRRREEDETGGGSGGRKRRWNLPVIGRTRANVPLSGVTGERNASWELLPLTCKNNPPFSLFGSFFSETLELCNCFGKYLLVLFCVGVVNA